MKKRNVSVPTLQLVKLPEGMSVENGIRYYMSDPNVAHAAPNYIRKPSSVPNDVSFVQQWGLNNTGDYAGGTADSDIDAPEAWNISPGSIEISRRAIVAVIDSGIDYNHPDLVGNIWTGEANCTNEIDDDENGYVDDCRGWDFFGNNNQPMDDQGHGTHVAGIIGAVGNNNAGNIRGDVVYPFNAGKIYRLL